MHQVDLAKPAVLSLVTGICQIADSHETSVKNAWLNWEKICLVDQFVRDLAVPLSVAPSASVEVAKGLVVALAGLSEGSRTSRAEASSTRLPE